MKRFTDASARLAATFGLLLTLTATLAAARDSNTAPTRVHVTWAAATSLSEVKDNPARRGTLRVNEWQKQLTDYVVRRADTLLPPGQQLDIAIDDIKLAGDFEPWQGPDAQDIRFMRDIYPPRVDLHYKLTDAHGTTIREGKARLRDLGYLQRPMLNDNDPLRYDKRLLGDWLSREFRNRAS